MASYFTDMELEYIKANGQYYRPQKAGIKDESKRFSNYPVCTIKKLLFGLWRIDYYCDHTQFDVKGGYSFGDEDTPNKRAILYPSGIEEISYLR
tara:strand:- start:285 stop:566 length:282 start_codon:yes stop_codon:yes gene_type:complete